MVDFVPAGLLLILVGVVIIIVGILASSKAGQHNVSGGGVVLLGPIPIAFGTDAKWTSIAIALAIVLIVISLLFYLV